MQYQVSYLASTDRLFLKQLVHLQAANRCNGYESFVFSLFVALLSHWFGYAST
ncbi:hypothetical protein ACN4EK_20665 [Pantanalinema rosaneae CENA516]|uniref:hypothetical protein n=1 Tax=Pantanalinema rosaneae TaxID=1620701 RepID=UPI003D6DBDD9